MGDLQLKQFQAERKLETDQKAADADLASFKGRLQERTAHFVALRKKALSSFAGYWTFQRALRQPHATPAPDAGRDALFEEFGAQLTNAETQFAAFRAEVLPRIFQFAQPVIVIPLLVVAGAVAALAIKGTDGIIGRHASGRRIYPLEIS